jgi:hypothetical protein
MLIITGQREGATYSVGGDKLLEQGSRKLNVLPGGAFDDDVAGGSAIIIQILVGGEAQVKLVSFHGIILCQQNANRARKQGCRRAGNVRRFREFAQMRNDSHSQNVAGGMTGLSRIGSFPCSWPCLLLFFSRVCYGMGVKRERAEQTDNHMKKRYSLCTRADSGAQRMIEPTALAPEIVIGSVESI